MLTDCLRSVVTQEVPQDISVDLVVVDNNQVPTVGPILDALRPESRFPIHHIHEMEPGIPVARNRGLEEALALKADWIVIIDDDEIAEPAWLSSLIEAAQTFGADVIQGKLNKIYPKPMPRFVLPINYPPRKEGQPMDVAYTHNVAFQAWLVDPARGGLRFDEQLRYTGGSDSHFFRHANKIGAKIVATERSVVTETQVTDRLSLRWQMSRSFRVGAGMVRSEKALGLAGKKRKRRPTVVVFRILRSIGTLIVSPLVLLFGFRRFESTVAHAFRNLASASGSLVGHFGFLPNPYRKIDGH